MKFYFYFVYKVILFNDVAAFLTQTVNLDDALVKFEIWDTAGQGSMNT